MGYTEHDTNLLSALGISKENKVKGKQNYETEGKNLQKGFPAPFLAIGPKQAIRASRFLMRNCSKKNTMTHLVIMPFLPKVHIMIPTSLARGHSGQSYCNTEHLPARSPWCTGVCV